MMGPGYPAYTQLYDLGNLPPYQFNLTLAKADLAASKVNVATMQPLDFRVIQGCGVCSSTAQVVAQDLSVLNIPVNVLVTTPSRTRLHMWRERAHTNRRSTSPRPSPT